MADASRRRQPDAIARAARQIDADDAVERAARSIASGIRWTEYRDDRGADRDRQMHGTTVTSDEKIEPFGQSSERQQVYVTDNIDHTFAKQFLCA